MLMNWEQEEGKDRHVSTVRAIGTPFEYKL